MKEEPSPWKRFLRKAFDQFWIPSSAQLKCWVKINVKTDRRKQTQPEGELLRMHNEQRFKKKQLLSDISGIPDHFPGGKQRLYPEESEKNSEN